MKRKASARSARSAKVDALPIMIDAAIPRIK
jgi:hypothetical protein